MMILTTAGLREGIRRPTRRMSMLLAASAMASASVSLGGCGVYLHDARLKASTAELKTTFEALQAPTMFAELKQREQSFAAEEDRAVAEQAVTARNVDLASFIRSPSIAASGNRPRTAMNTLLEEVETELIVVYGKNALEPASLTQLFNAADRDFRRSTELRRMQANIAGESADFLEAQRIFNATAEEAQKDKRKADCKSVLTTTAVSGQLDLDARYGILAASCKQLQRLEQNGITAMMTAAAPGSQLHGLGQELARLNREKAEAEIEKAKIEAEIKKLTQAATPTNLAALNQEIEKVGEVLAAANPYVQQAGLESLSEVIEAALAAELKTDGSAEASDMSAQAAAALQMLRAMATAKDAFSPDPNKQGAAELLLAAAYLRHQLRVIQVDVARDEALRKNYEAQGLALLTKVSHLVRVYTNLQTTGLAGAGDFATARASKNDGLRAAAGETLASYLGAWNYGEIPRRVLAFRNVQIQRASALEKAALTEEDYRTTLKPVFDELAAYGEGGIHPETIVEVLSNLGLATAVLGD